IGTLLTRENPASRMHRGSILLASIDPTIASYQWKSKKMTSPQSTKYCYTGQGHKMSFLW
ncbi:MAG TPA: hypothetical protein VGL94_02550, partial [Ktedonobacteraceae bacterium]